MRSDRGRNKRRKRNDEGRNDAGGRKVTRAWKAPDRRVVAKKKWTITNDIRSEPSNGQRGEKSGATTTVPGEPPTANSGNPDRWREEEELRKVLLQRVAKSTVKRRKEPRRRVNPSSKTRAKKSATAKEDVEEGEILEASTKKSSEKRAAPPGLPSTNQTAEPTETNGKKKLPKNTSKRGSRAPNGSKSSKESAARPQPAGAPGDHPPSKAKSATSRPSLPTRPDPPTKRPHPPPLNKAKPPALPKKPRTTQPNSADSTPSEGLPSQPTELHAKPASTTDLGTESDPAKKKRRKKKRRRRSPSISGARADSPSRRKGEARKERPKREESHTPSNSSEDSESRRSRKRRRSHREKPLKKRKRRRPVEKDGEEQGKTEQRPAPKAAKEGTPSGNPNPRSVADTYREPTASTNPSEAVTSSQRSKSVTRSPICIFTKEQNSSEEVEESPRSYSVSSNSPGKESDTRERSPHSDDKGNDIMMSIGDVEITLSGRKKTGDEKNTKKKEDKQADRRRRAHEWKKRKLGTVYDVARKKVKKDSEEAKDGAISGGESPTEMPSGKPPLKPAFTTEKEESFDFSGGEEDEEVPKSKSATESSESDTAVVGGAPDGTASPEPALDGPPPTSAAAEEPEVPVEKDRSPKTLNDILPDDWDVEVHGCRRLENHYNIKNLLDQGTYGYVYRAVCKKTNEMVALKKIKMQQSRDGFPITSLRELALLMEIDHPNVVKAREIVVSKRNIREVYMVMEFCDHDLSAIQKIKKHPFSLSELKCVMQQLLSGVAYMHENWMLHRDLKPSNLLLSFKGVLKICDFGMARRYGSPIEPYTPNCCTMWYQSPEMLLGAKTYNQAVDVWAVGCIMAELVLGGPLFRGDTTFSQLSKIFKIMGTPNESTYPGWNQLDMVKRWDFKNESRTFRSLFYHQGPTLTRSCSLTPEGMNLLEGMLHWDPEQRISAPDALNHTWFTESPKPCKAAHLPTFPKLNDKKRSHAIRCYKAKKQQEAAELRSKGGFHFQK